MYLALLFAFMILGKCAESEKTTDSIDDSGDKAMVLPGTDGESVVSSGELARLKHVEKMYNLTQFNPDWDDMNHLEYYWHHWFHVIKSSIPLTDEECYFNVTAWRCFPVCKCSFQMQTGDYTPSRSCRYSDPDELGVCLADYRDEAWMMNFGKKVQDIIRLTTTKIRDSIPDTDEECSYEFKSNRCYPENRCSFQWRIGDFHPSRACRLRQISLLGLDDLDDDELNVLSKHDPRDEPS